MKSIDPATIRDGVIYHHDSQYSDNPMDLANTHDFWFNEGSSIRKRNGIYYYVYAQGGRHGRRLLRLLWPTRRPIAHGSVIYLSRA